MFKPGQPSRCHKNASRLWAKSNQLQLVTGYVLHAEDSGELEALWRQHSWCWNPKTSALIETTVPAKKYFGAAMDDFDALHFAIENVDEFDDPQYVPPRMAKCAFNEYFFDQGRGNREPGVVGTLWAAFNGVTEWQDHRKSRQNENQRLASTWFGGSYQTKSRAFSTIFFR